MGTITQPDLRRHFIFGTGEIIRSYKNVRPLRAPNIPSCFRQKNVSFTPVILHLTQKSERTSLRNSRRNNKGNTRESLLIAVVIQPKRESPLTSCAEKWNRPWKGSQTSRPPSVRWE